MAYYQILYWQNLPSQVKAWVDFDEVKIEMPPRFTVRIDQEAQAQGLVETDVYLQQWHWSEIMEREGAPQEVASAIRKELEASAGD